MRTSVYKKAAGVGTEIMIMTYPGNRLPRPVSSVSLFFIDVPSFHFMRMYPVFAGSETSDPAVVANWIDSRKNT